jgi:hypothetical protein
MAVETLRPTANGGTIEWNYAGSGSPGSNYDQVMESSADDDTTYVLHNFGSTILKRDLYVIANTGIAGGAAISNVRVVIRAIGATAQKGQTTVHPLKAYIRENSTNSTAASSQNTSGSYTNYNFDFAVRPSDGGAWTVSDLTGFQAGPSCQANNGLIRVTQVYVIVTYTLPASGRSFGTIIG